ncbi:ABC transporter permease [Fischerella sp. PCC 9605]|uniref:ABC transporter permease n=1 Tax=Fischerella sp. PCC 9605 TaxID=1173024 RepID=UPI0004798A84|nr:ABC transporter permease [Fischerella sp. PCC 9605]
MILNFLDRLGDWNPQLLRELRGRLQIRNILLAITVSLLGQFLLFISFQAQLPTYVNTNDVITNHPNKYCTGNLLYGLPQCVQDEFGNAIINSQLWWLDLFTWLSIISCFTFLVIGTYLIISDLATEESRDTLNFIRLSPQPPQSILMGKMLGVPILPYLAVAVAIPLHVFSGLRANIPFGMILSFDAVVLTACLFYYSAALLFGLVGTWLGGFQAWLGSGIVLSFLLFTMNALADVQTNFSLILLRFFNPFYFIPNLSDSSAYRTISLWADFHWFALPLGASWITIIGLGLVNYAALTRFIWLSLQRCFRNPNATMLSKQQSYLLTSYFSVLALGCANWQSIVWGKFPDSTTMMKDNIACLLFLHLWLFLYLIAAISPHRQTLQDWARYRHISSHKSLWNRYTIKDLIWGEKSPGLVAIALNAIIAISSLGLLILLADGNVQDKINAVYALALAGSLAMLYAALTQLLLFMKTKHRVFWAAGSLGAAITLPIFILLILFNYPGNNTFVWLFSIAAPLIALYTPTGEPLSPITVLFVILVQVSILALLVLQLRRKLQKSGESATKALFSQ